MRSAVVLVFVLVLLGCGSSREREAPRSADAAAGGTPVLSDDEAAALLASWQGIWVMPYRREPGGAHVVYEVRDAAITEWRGDVPADGEIEILAPCLAKVGGDSFQYVQFGFAGPRLHVENHVGVRRGPDDVVICTGESTVIAATAAGCRVLEMPPIGRRGRGLGVVAGATCSVAPDPSDPTGRVVARYAIGTRDERVYEMRVDGDLLLPAISDREPAFRAASLDDARLRAR